MRAEGAVGSAGARCTVRDVQPVLTWADGTLNGRVGDPSGSMRSSATAAQSSAARLLLLQVAAQEGPKEVTEMPFYITLSFAAVLHDFTLVFLFFTSVLLHHSMEFRLAHAGHIGHVGVHLVAIMLPSRPGNSDCLPCYFKYHSVA